MKMTEKVLPLKHSGESKKNMEEFTQNIDLILKGETKSLKYQLAYDVVYKLTKDHRQQELLSTLEQKLGTYLSQQYKDLLPDGSATKMLRILQEAATISGKMAEVCLFLDVNYCQKEQNLPLRKRLADATFKSLSSEDKTLAIAAHSAFKARNGDRSECNALFAFISTLDEKEEFFQRYLLPHYEPLLKKHYEDAGQKEWKQKTLVEYLEWCRKVLEDEMQFGKAVLVKKKGQEGLQSIQNTIYSILVVAYKPRIYQADEQTLFEQLTLPILELFRLGRQKEVEGHIQWFMGRVEARLNAIPTNENAAFLTAFCQLYHRVAALLKDTQGRFQINYRAVFTFEQWINNQKFNVPMRLNLLLDAHLRSGKPQQDVVASAILVFKLVKEKTLFQNLYRRLLLERLVHLYKDYNLDEELRIVELMEKECGDEWTKRIKSICQLFIKNRQAFHREGDALLPVIVEEGDWPFQHKQTKIVLHQQLTEMTPSFEKAYLPANKNHRLLWSPRVGTVTLSIKFKGGSRVVVVPIEAANLLLYLQKAPLSLAGYLCETGYKLDEVQPAIQSLLSSKLLLSTPKGSDFLLQLPMELPSGGSLDLVAGKHKGEIEVKAMEELKADRKLMVEAIIVKIMKGEKMAKRDELMLKTAPLLANRGFNFNADFVQKSIDRLLEKEFLRDFEDGSLGYIA